MNYLDDIHFMGLYTIQKYEPFPKSFGMVFREASIAVFITKTMKTCL